MLGRIVLIPVNKWVSSLQICEWVVSQHAGMQVGEYLVVYFYMLLAIACEITIWVVPSIIENAIAVRTGLFLLSSY